MWLGDAPTHTNNVAEYQALCWGLHHAQQLQARDLIVISDSQLLVRQITGRYQVNCPTLLALHQRARHLAAPISSVNITWRRRDHLAIADRLANLAMAFRSSYWWTGECSWDAALFSWRAQHSLAPSPYLTTEPGERVSLAPLFHSAAQVSEFLHNAVRDLKTMTAPAFQRLLSDTFARASLPGQQLKHGSHLYTWTRARCSSRPLRNTAPTAVFVVHLDTSFDDFWNNTLLDAKLRPPTHCPCQAHRHPPPPGPPYPHRQWLNPALHPQAHSQAGPPPALHTPPPAIGAHAFATAPAPPAPTTTTPAPASFVGGPDTAGSCSTSPASRWRVQSPTSTTHQPRGSARGCSARPQPSLRQHRRNTTPLSSPTRTCRQGTAHAATSSGSLARLQSPHRQQRRRNTTPHSSPARTPRRGTASAATYQSRQTSSSVPHPSRHRTSGTSYNPPRHSSSPSSPSRRRSGRERGRPSVDSSRTVRSSRATAGPKRDTRHSGRSCGPPALSKLVTVRWVTPATTDRQLLENLRDAGLFIPAGTYVHAGYNRVRILEFPRRSDVFHLLATKGALLKGTKDISINPARTSRRLSYSETRAISRCTGGQQH